MRGAKTTRQRLRSVQGHIFVVNVNEAPDVVLIAFEDLGMKGESVHFDLLRFKGGLLQVSHEDFCREIRIRPVIFRIDPEDHVTAQYLALVNHGVENYPVAASPASAIR